MYKYGRIRIVVMYIKGGPCKFSCGITNLTLVLFKQAYLKNAIATRSLIAQLVKQINRNRLKLIIKPNFNLSEQVVQN